MIPLKGVTWFEEIDFELEKPKLARKISFNAVKKRLLTATTTPKKIY
jgi:predicted nucleic acid-binding protein